MTEKEIKLVEDSIPLALHIAKRWAKKTGMDMDDIVSAAEYGLVKAAIGFDPDRGRFSTYAGRVIENEIIRDLKRDKHMSGMTVSFEETVNDTDGITLGETVSDTRDYFADIDARDALRDKSRFLTETERRAVLIRMDHPEKNQTECGMICGCSQSLFSRRLISARKKLGM